MREAVRCEKRRSFPEGKRSVWGPAAPAEWADAQKRRETAAGLTKSGLRALSGDAAFKEIYCRIFNALGDFAWPKGKRFRASRHYFFGREAVSSPGEWFGINFVTISATGVGVCSI